MATSQGATRLLKHSSLYAIGGIARNLIGFVMLPIYTSYLSPSDYGVVSLLTFALSLLELFFGGRLGYAIPKFFHEQKAEAERKALISTAFYFMTALGVVTTTLVLALREQGSEILFGAPTYANVVALFSALIVGQTIETHGLDLIRLQEKPVLFLFMGLGKLALQVAMNLWFVVHMDLGVLGVAYGSMISSTVAAIALGIYTLTYSGFGFRRDYAISMLKFSWPMWLGGIAGLYIGSSNKYFIRVLSSINDVGLYSLAERFASISSTLIWGPFWQYWMPVSYKYYTDKGPPSPVFRSVFTTLCLILVVAGFGISTLSGTAVKLMSNPEFAPAMRAVPYLVLAGIFNCCTGYVNFSFLVTNNTTRLSINHYLTAAIITVLYLLLIPALGYVGAALAVALAQAMQFAIVYLSARRYYDMGLSLMPLFSLLVFGSVLYLLCVSFLSFENVWTELFVRSAAVTISSGFLVAVALANADYRSKVVRLIAPLLGRA